MLEELLPKGYMKNYRWNNRSLSALGLGSMSRRLSW